MVIYIGRGRASERLSLSLSLSLVLSLSVLHNWIFDEPTITAVSKIYIYIYL